MVALKHSSHRLCLFLGLNERIPCLHEEAGLDSELTHSVCMFVQLLREPSAEVRRSAAKHLGRLGRLAAPAMAALTESLCDSDVRVRGAVSDAMDAIRADMQEAKSASNRLSRWQSFAEALRRAFCWAHA